MALDLSVLWRFYARRSDLFEEGAAYKAAFQNARSQRYVVADLAEFCGVGRPMPADPYAMARAAGRQDVWNHIQMHLQFSQEQLFQMMQREETRR